MDDLLDIKLTIAQPPIESEPVKPQAPVVTIDPVTVDNSQSSASVKQNLAKIPDIGQMQQKLESSGKLLNEIGINRQTKVDTSPLASLQPQNMLITDQGPQPMRLPSEHENKLLGIELATTGSQHFFSINWSNVGRCLIRLLILGVFASVGIYGLLRSATFFFSDYPILEKSQAMNGADLNLSALLITQLLVTASAIILVGLSFRLILNKPLTATYLIISFAILIVCLVFNYQNSAVTLNILEQKTTDMSGSGEVVTDTLLKYTPFLERQTDGTVKAVWYK